MPSQKDLAMYRGRGMSEESDSDASPEIKRFRDFVVNVTFIADFGMVDGSGNATVTESEVCVHEYGGGVGTASASRSSSARGIGAISSGVGL